MRSIVIGFVGMFLLMGCQMNEDVSDMERLADIIVEQNNAVLSEFKYYNDYAIMVKMNILESKDNRDLVERVSSLIRLNNSQKRSRAELVAFIELNNSQNSDYCRIEIDQNDIINNWDISKYYMTLHEIIKQSCLSLGNIHESNNFLNLSVDNDDFYVHKSDSLIVKIRSFPQRTSGTFEYMLFDTLEFKLDGAYSGRFKFPVSNQDFGKYQKKIIVYGKDVFTGKTEEVAKMNITYTILD